jgi:hypothetical protein
MFREDSSTSEQDSKCSMVLQRNVLHVTDLSVSDLMGFWSLLKESNFLGVALYVHVSDDEAYTTLDMHGC